MQTKKQNLELIEPLSPNKLWKFFAELSNIPRPSNNEQAVIKWLIKFANDRKLQYKLDKSNNLTIFKPKQNTTSNKVLMMQSHMDMVCEKDLDSDHDFHTDPIKLRLDEDYLYATKTTLGSDNGIGLVASLCILDDISTSHPALQVLFTADEETGMSGIMNLENSHLNPDYVLNLDTEEEGSVYISSAGSRDLHLSMQENKEVTNQHLYQIKITGLPGGHSGVDIHQNRLNAIKLIGEVLYKISKYTTS